MRVVVVGGTGNIGSALVDALERDPDIDEIRIVARRAPSVLGPKSTHVCADIVTSDLDEAVKGADAAVHLAWLFQPTHRPDVTWKTNVGGTTRLFDAVARKGVPVLLYSSSVGAYSPAYGVEVDESWPTHALPTCGYGREKAYVERVLDSVDARHPGLRIVRMRPGFVFQRSAASEQLRLFGGPLVPASLLRPGLVPALPFPAGLRFQAVHAADVARAFLLALKDAGARGAYNLAADPVVDGQQLAHVLGADRVLPIPPWVVRAALSAAWHARIAPAEPALFDLAMALPVMRTGRARVELGWIPEIESTAALAEALAGMREGAGGSTVPLAPDSPRARLAGFTRIRTGTPAGR